MKNCIQFFLILLILTACREKENEKKTFETVSENFAESEQSTESQNEIINKDELILSIDFQDFFEEDKVSFLINDCLVFKNRILTSDKIDGLTDIIIKIKKENSASVIFINNKEKVKCKTIDDSVELKIYVNEIENTFTLDLSNGKFVGLEKMNNNRLRLNQSKRQFEYD